MKIRVMLVVVFIALAGLLWGQQIGSGGNKGSNISYKQISQNRSARLLSDTEIEVLSLNTDVVKKADLLQQKSNLKKQVQTIVAAINEIDQLLLMFVEETVPDVNTPVIGGPNTVSPTSVEPNLPAVVEPNM